METKAEEMSAEVMGYNKKSFYPNVMISGYFDPIQPGHIELFKYAKGGSYLGDYCRVPHVIAVIHTPRDIIKKSGFYIYETEELKSILLGHKLLVDEVVEAVDVDGLVAETIRKIRPEYFVKGPDRHPENMPEEELLACEEVGCKIIYQPGRKINSSSNIKNRIYNQISEMVLKRVSN